MSILQKFIEEQLINPITIKLQENLANSFEKIQTEDGEIDVLSFANAINPRITNSKMRPNATDNPENMINPLVLRDFSVHYPIARACIDYIKTKVVQLEWAVLPVDEENAQQITNEETRVRDIEKFFKKPFGEGSSFRKLQEMIIEDFLVMGSVSIENVKTVGGELSALLPFDVGTLKLRLLEDGRTPTPPEIAYEQWIRGKKVAEFTTEDLIFITRNNRTNSPFGLSPLESLIIQVQAALSSDVYNYKFFTDSNLAEGFMELPEEWTVDQIKQFQTYFDGIMAGDPRMQRRIKFMPGGAKYTPTKKPGDMAFEQFNEWLLMQTCSVFGVPPQDLGFTADINRATGEVQSEKGQERAKRPMVNMLEELFTYIIQEEMGYEDLKFTYLDVDPVDKLQEAQIDTLRINAGIEGVDEIRVRDGLNPIGLDNYIKTGSGPILVEDIKSGKYMQNNSGETANTADDDVRTSTGKPEDDVDDDIVRAEIKTWRKCVLKDIKMERPIRDFITYNIPEEIKDDIEDQLLMVDSTDDVKKVFSIYLNGEYDTILKFKRIANELEKHL